MTTVTIHAHPGKSSLTMFRTEKGGSFLNWKGWIIPKCNPIVFSSTQQIVVKRGNSGENVNKVLSGTLCCASIVCANKRGVKLDSTPGASSLTEVRVCVCVGGGGVMIEFVLKVSSFRRIATLSQAGDDMDARNGYVVCVCVCAMLMCIIGMPIEYRPTES